MVSNTSIAAYHDTGTERLRQRDRIVQHMDDVGWTRRELAKALGMEASSMSGRIKELIDEGRVRVMPYRSTCEVTGRMVQVIKRR